MIFNNYRYIYLTGFLIIAGLLFGCNSPTMQKEDNMNKTKNNKILLMKKQILVESSEVLYEKFGFTQQEFDEQWTIHHSEWKVEDGWLVGENKGNWPGMAILKQDFPGNVLVEFEAQTVEMIVLENDKNHGKGFCVRQGMLRGRGDLLLMCDADMSTPISEMATLEPWLSEGYDVVIASRDQPDSKLDPPQPLKRRCMA